MRLKMSFLGALACGASAMSFGEYGLRGTFGTVSGAGVGIFLGGVLICAVKGWMGKRKAEIHAEFTRGLHK